MHLTLAAGFCPCCLAAKFSPCCSESVTLLEATPAIAKRSCGLCKKAWPWAQRSLPTLCLTSPSPVLLYFSSESTSQGNLCCMTQRHQFCYPEDFQRSSTIVFGPALANKQTNTAELRQNFSTTCSDQHLSLLPFHCGRVCWLATKRGFILQSGLAAGRSGTGLPSTANARSTLAMTLREARNFHCYQNISNLWDTLAGSIFWIRTLIILSWMLLWLNPFSLCSLRFCARVNSHSHSPTTAALAAVV